MHFISLMFNLYLSLCFDGFDSDSWIPQRLENWMNQIVCQLQLINNKKKNRIKKKKLKKKLINKSWIDRAPCGLTFQL